MKIRLGKKEDSGLRPLSEKEIQKRLYGSILEEGAKTQEPPPVETAGNGPARKDPPKESKETSRVSVTVKRPSLFSSFKLPWREIASALAEVSEALIGTARRSLPKISNKWAMGVGIVAALFVGIHFLNIYRTNAMKAPQATPSFASDQSPLSDNQPVESANRPAESPSGPPSPPPAPKVQAKKSYAVQVATYANERDAQRLSDQISADGFSSFVHTSGRPGAKTYHLVCLGRFKTFQEAQARFQEFRQKSIAKDFPDSFVRTL